MNIDFFKGLEIGGDLKKDEIKEFQLQLSNKLNKMEDTYTIDRFENNIAICENRSTGEFIEIQRDRLPKDIKEGTIIRKQNDVYIIDTDKTEEVAQRIKSKMDRLWN